MVITRKIEVFVCESDKELQKTYYQKLYDNRNIAVKVANMAASHLFALDNTMPYLSEKDQETIEFLGVKGQAATRKNAPYVAASNLFKGQADMGMVSSVLQNVQKMYQDDRKKGMWERSLRSYKFNMPVPFKADRFLNLRFAEYVNGDGDTRTGCFFTLMGVPFQMRFGRDRSGNRLIVERILQQQLFDSTSGTEGEATGYKMCTSSIAFEKKTDPETEKKKQKIFLYLCVSIPEKKVDLIKNKTMFCYLGLLYPIQYLYENKADSIFDSGVQFGTIGSAEEFIYRRTQIQAALRRCQKDSRWSLGGKGRKRKLQALERYKKKEKDYITTRLHAYTRKLIDLAVSNRCDTIHLVNQKPREDQAKKDNEKGKPYVLRNWSYYGLKTMIGYKAKMYGIKVISKEEKEEDQS